MTDRNSETTAPQSSVKPELTRLLVLEIALPDYYAEDLTPEAADEFMDGDMDELIHGSLCLVTPHVRLIATTGDKGGTETQDVEGIVLGGRVESDRSVLALYTRATAERSLPEEGGRPHPNCRPVIFDIARAALGDEQG